MEKYVTIPPKTTPSFSSFRLLYIFVLNLGFMIAFSNSSVNIPTRTI